MSGISWKQLFILDLRWGRYSILTNLYDWKLVSNFKYFFMIEFYHKVMFTIGLMT